MWLGGAVILAAAAIGGDVWASSARADANAFPAPLAGLVLVSTDEAAHRAVVKVADDTLRVVEPGDSLFDGRVVIEVVTASKLALRYRLSIADERTVSGQVTTPGLLVDVTADEWVRAWVYLRKTGKTGSPVLILRSRAPLGEAALQFEAGAAPRKMAEGVKESGDVESPSPQQ